MHGGNFEKKGNICFLCSFFDQHRSAGLIDAMYLKDALSQIQPNRCDRHRKRSCSCFG